MTLARKIWDTLCILFIVFFWAATSVFLTAAAWVIIHPFAGFLVGICTLILSAYAILDSVAEL